MAQLNWIESDQWHALWKVDDTGWTARCGAPLTDSMKARKGIPVNEATCNTCTELLVLDQEKAEGDTPEDAAVPE